MRVSRTVSFYDEIISLGTFPARLVEDFETILELDGTKCHLEIVECPFKYEMFRRPTLVFKPEFSYVEARGYNAQTNHQACLEECLRKTYQTELRLRSKLKFALGNNQTAGNPLKTADFLLKSDPKLGGVLLYKTNHSSRFVS